MPSGPSGNVRCWDAGVPKANTRVARSTEDPHGRPLDSVTSKLDQLIDG